MSNNGGSQPSGFENDSSGLFTGDSDPVLICESQWMATLPLTSQRFIHCQRRQVFHETYLLDIFSLLMSHNA